MKPNFDKHNEDLPDVHVDPPVTDSEVEDIEPAGNTAEIPGLDEPAPKPGKVTPGSRPDRTDAPDFKE